MLSNAYFLAKFRFDTAENEPAKNLQKFAKNLQFCHFVNFANPNPLPLSLTGAFLGRGAAEPGAGAALAGPRRREGAGAAPGADPRSYNIWQNFGKISLVFGCIGTDICK